MKSTAAALLTIALAPLAACASATGDDDLMASPTSPPMRSTGLDAAVDAAGRKTEGNVDAAPPRRDPVRPDAGPPPPPPPTSCRDVLAADPSAPSGRYMLTVSPQSTVEVLCDMTASGGGWTSLSPGYLARLTPQRRRYMFRCDGQCRGALPLGTTANDSWYVTPEITAVWSWTAPTIATGTWLFGSRGGASGTLSCPSHVASETPPFGVGCTSSPGAAGIKVIPWPAIGFVSDPSAAETGICQGDSPGLFGTWSDGPNNACVSHVRVYERSGP